MIHPALRPIPFNLPRWLPCAAALCVAPLFAQEQESTEPPMRVWTSVNGNEVEGSFVKEEDGKVYLKRPDGTTIATTREKLSPNDLLWIDQRTAPPGKAEKTESFTKAKQLEITKMEEYKKIRRLFLKTYADLTNNDRENKMLAFLERNEDPNVPDKEKSGPVYGWGFVSSECYLTPAGKKGKIKILRFFAKAPIELREAVQMTRDKFVLTMPDPVVVKEVTFNGDTYWEVQNPPPYVARALLLVDPATKNIKRFDFHFPPPETGAGRN